MADKKFNITIQAYDKATGIVAKVNKKLSDINQPVNKFQKAMSNFAKESGINNLMQNLDKTARAAEKVASGIASVAAPLAAVFGATSIAGVAMMTDEWGKLGRAISLTSQYTNQSISQVQQWMGAAKAMGIEASATQSTIVGFGTALEDALYGRNQDMLALMNQLKIGIGGIGSGVRDETDVLLDFADAVQKLQKTNPFAAKKAIDLAGLTTMAPLLLKGREGIKQLMDIQKQYGYQQSEDSVRRADAFRTSVLKLTTAIAGMRNQIADKLMPVFQPLVEKWALFSAQNGAKIGDALASAFKPLVDMLMRVDFQKVLDGITKYIKDADQLISSTIGWKNALIGLAIVLNAGWIVNVFRLGLGLVKLTVGIIRVIPAIFYLSRAFGVLTISMLGIELPIWLIIGAIALLGLAAYELYEHWSELGDMWDSLWDGMAAPVKKAVSAILDAMFPLRAVMRQAQVVWNWTHRGDPSAGTPPDISGLPMPAASGAARSLNMYGPAMPGPLALPPIPGQNDTSQDKTQGVVKVDVNFKNAPKGTRVSVQQVGAVDAGARTQSALTSSP